MDRACGNARLLRRQIRGPGPWSRGRAESRPSRCHPEL